MKTVFIAIFFIAVASSVDVRSLLRPFSDAKFPDSWSSEINLKSEGNDKQFEVVSNPDKYALDFKNSTKDLQGYSIIFKGNHSSYYIISVKGGPMTCTCNKKDLHENTIPSLDGFKNTGKPCYRGVSKLGTMYTNTTTDIDGPTTIISLIDICFGSRPYYYLSTEQMIIGTRKTVLKSRVDFNKYSSPADPALDKRLSFPALCNGVICT